jgi:hypothetical protein
MNFWYDNSEEEKRLLEEKKRSDALNAIGSTRSELEKMGKKETAMDALARMKKSASSIKPAPQPEAIPGTQNIIDELITCQKKLIKMPVVWKQDKGHFRVDFEL